jgi:hypothetical protein
MADLGNVGKLMRRGTQGGPYAHSAFTGTFPNCGSIAGYAAQGGKAGAHDVSLFEEYRGQIAHKTARASDGYFVFPDLPDGRYWVRIESANGSFKSRMFGPIRPVTLGPELLENPSFADTSEWTTPSGSSISNGALHSTDSANKTVYQAETLEAGATYEVTFTVSAYGGSGYVQARLNVSPYDGSNLISGTQRTAVGTYTERLVVPTAGTDRFELRFNNPNGISVSSVSCKKVLY